MTCRKPWSVPGGTITVVLSVDPGSTSFEASGSGAAADPAGTTGSTTATPTTTTPRGQPPASGKPASGKPASGGKAEAPGPRRRLDHAYGHSELKCFDRYLFLFTAVETAGGTAVGETLGTSRQRLVDRGWREVGVPTIPNATDVVLSAPLTLPRACDTAKFGLDGSVRI